MTHLTTIMFLCYNDSMIHDKRQKNLQVKVDVELHKTLKRLAAEKETTISAIVRKLLVAWIAEQEEPPND
jgi:ABC-type enterochelin transport system ATPase subunit